MKIYLNRLLGYAPALLVSLAIVFTAGPASAVETITYYHNDIAGTPILATDAAGAVLWKENYRPYGDKLNNPPAGADNKLGFTGKPYDPNTGLSYMGARYYDPVIGRFAGIDPLDYDEKNLHSFNRYTYANNNPYKFVDPDGRAAETVLDVISLALSIAAYKQDPSLINALGVGYDAVATAVPFLPAGFGILKNTERAVDALNDARKGANELKAGSAGIERAGKDFTKKTKAEIDAENAAKNGGVNKCERCGVEVVPGKKSESGVTPPHNERQRDHIISKAQGGDGTLANGQVLCRSCNIRKSDN